MSTPPWRLLVKHPSGSLERAIGVARRRNLIVSSSIMAIDAAASGREVRIAIADKGIGIDAAEQAHIFEPFYRTPDVIAAQFQGAGLGLSRVATAPQSAASPAPHQT